jgi:MerR family copper efflux transcriptional regulator
MDEPKDMLTIGQLAKRVGLRTSALRYYEEQGLLTPADRTEAGYRLYGPEAEQTLRFIRRAQRLGFALADIRLLLQGLQAHSLSDEAIVDVAERRFVSLERQLTELLVLRHEMQSFLLELQERVARAPDLSSELFFDRLVNRVCSTPPSAPRANSILEWLIEQTHCTLNMPDAQSLLDRLRGQHIHLWQEGETYHILVISDDPNVEDALRTLAQLEVNCQAHTTPQLRQHQEGFLFSASGENAFIFARLFLALSGDGREEGLVTT